MDADGRAMSGLACVQWLGRIGLAFLLVGCGVAAPTGTATPPTVTPPAEIATATANPSSAPTPSSTPSIADILKIGPLAPIESGTYFIDADTDPYTPLRVVYDIPAKGWSQWIGAAKFSDVGHVGVSITTVVNLVHDGCRDHSWADPPIGPSVNDLAAALAALAPFRVTSPPAEVTIYGYSGKHLELTVPELPVDGGGEHGHFTGCTDADLKSWVAPHRHG
jgi:hypothetical protein